MALRRQNYNTKSRNLISFFLKENAHKALSAMQIIAFLNKQELNISESTVYRYLSKLVSDGEIKKYAGNDKGGYVYQYAGKDNMCSSHLHLKCSSCGSITHLDCDFMQNLSRHLSFSHGFYLSCEGSILYGLCENCKK